MDFFDGLKKAAKAVKDEASKALNNQFGEEKMNDVKKSVKNLSNSVVEDAGTLANLAKEKIGKVFNKESGEQGAEDADNHQQPPQKKDAPKQEF